MSAVSRVSTSMPSFLGKSSTLEQGQEFAAGIALHRGTGKPEVASLKIEGTNCKVYRSVDEWKKGKNGSDILVTKGAVEFGLFGISDRFDYEFSKEGTKIYYQGPGMHSNVTLSLGEDGKILDKDGSAKKSILVMHLDRAYLMDHSMRRALKEASAIGNQQLAENIISAIRTEHRSWLV